MITISKIYGTSLDELVGNTDTENSYTLDDDGDDDDFLEGETEIYNSDGKPVGKKSRVFRVLYALPYPIIVTVMFFLWGFLWDGFYVSWTLFITIPIYYSVIDCIKTKKLGEFAYPVLAAFAYLLVGMMWGLWHPCWIIFITIPIYYAIADAIDRK